MTSHVETEAATAVLSSSGQPEALSLEIGQRFANVEQFRDSLQNFAIKRNFDFKFIKNEKHRVTVECAAGDCEWRLHASKEYNRSTFRIKTMHPSHTCGGGLGSVSHPKRLRIG